MADFSAFVETKLVVNSGCKVLAKDISVVWVEWNKSTTGKLKVLSYLASLPGVERVGSWMQGVSIKKDSPKEAKIENTLTAYEQECIRLKEEKVKLQAQKEAREKEMEQQRLQLQVQKEAREKEMEQQRLQLQTQKEAREKEMEQQRLQLQAQKEAREEEMGRERLDFDRYKLATEMAEKEKDRKFMEKENNKNRAFHMVTKYNKWLDPEVYGTPSKQFVAVDSLLRCVEFNEWDYTGEHNSSKVSNMKTIAENEAKDVQVMLGGSIEVKRCLPVVEAINLVENNKMFVEDKSQDILVKRLKEIPIIAVRDEDRHIALESEWLESAQDLTAKKQTDKYKYVKPANKMESRHGKVYIKCDCCAASVKLDDKGCARGHILPKSKGGSWSEDNIRLICATCNNNMGDSMTIREYKVGIFVKQKNTHK